MTKDIILATKCTYVVKEIALNRVSLSFFFRLFFGFGPTIRGTREEGLKNERERERKKRQEKTPRGGGYIFKVGRLNAVPRWHDN